jgi:hypothetical protein
MSKPRRSFDPTVAKVAISIPAGAEDQLLTKRQAAELEQIPVDFTHSLHA